MATLDLKHPTVVIVGHLNSAILSEPGWIAKHILDIPDGQQVDLQAVVVGAEVAPGQVSSQKHIWLFERFGISCTGQRLELYARDIDEPQAVYEVISRLGAMLPHTPVSAVGVNFRFELAEDLAAITPLFETAEGFDLVGVIRTQERKDSIEVSEENLLEIYKSGRPQTTLNLSRSTNFTTAQINFNYHLDLPNIDLLPRWVEGDPISHWFVNAMGVMTSCYGIENVEKTYL